MGFLSVLSDFSGSQITGFVFTHERIMSFFLFDLVTLSYFTKSLNTKVGDVICNCIASLSTMIQYFELIIQEIREKLDLEIYRFSETQSFNNIFIFSGCYR